MKAKFYRCQHCGNIVMSVEDSGVPVICCGEPMQELIAGTVDASLEKHVPVYVIKDNTVHVKVGSEEHPSTPDHYLQWIGISTDKGVQIRDFKAGDKPEACFRICDNEKVVNAFCYCNLHGKWSSK